jgi:hypothetical protein
MATENWETFCRGVRMLGEDEAKTWHRSLRERVKLETASQGEQLSGHIDDILERLGHFQTRHGRRDEDK